jgi:hypothetical protein
VASWNSFGRLVVGMYGTPVEAALRVIDWVSMEIYAERWKL